MIGKRCNYGTDHLEKSVSTVRNTIDYFIWPFVIGTQNWRLSDVINIQDIGGSVSF